MFASWRVGLKLKEAVEAKAMFVAIAGVFGWDLEDVGTVTGMPA